MGSRVRGCLLVAVAVLLWLVLGMPLLWSLMSGSEELVYYACLVPLLLPVTVVAAYFMWLSMEVFSRS